MYSPDRRFRRGHLRRALIIAISLGLHACAARPSIPFEPSRISISPFGYIDFCRRNPGDCPARAETPPTELTPERWLQLNRVNDWVNFNVPQISDFENYGVTEFWTMPNWRGGDCEDLALLKRQKLSQRGWPLGNLLLVEGLDVFNEKHLALAIRTDRGLYILDSREPSILSWDQAPYIWLRRQTEGYPNIWRALTGGN